MTAVTRLFCPTIAAVLALAGAAGAQPSPFDVVRVSHTPADPPPLTAAAPAASTRPGTTAACFGGCGSSCGCQATQGSSFCPCSGAARAAGARERAVVPAAQAQPVVQFRLPAVQGSCANGSCGVVQTRRGLFR